MDILNAKAYAVRRIRNGNKMPIRRNYVIRRTDNGKCWDFKECAWVEKVNDCCKITEYVAFLLVRLSEEVAAKMSNKEAKYD